MFNPHAQGIRAKERYHRDGPFVEHINKSRILSASPLPKGQAETTVSKDLGRQHNVYIIHDVLSDDERIAYLQHAADAPRVPNSRTAGASTELHYTRDGSVPAYADVNQPTAALPPHVLTVSDKAADCIQSAVGTNVFTVLDTCVDMQLGHTLSRGGSLRAQSDTASMWGCVALVSFGQTRWIRISKKNAS